MKIEIKDNGVRQIAELLAKHGHEARLVGGAVRDIVSGQQPKDLDIATTAVPDSVMEIAVEKGLRVIPTGLQHGTVTVVLDDVGYEITTLRRDVETDGRHASVEFVSDFKTDAARRDFTFNAMSASIDGEVHDYFGGIDDLKSGRVRFVGDAKSRIEEDYLRILRFFRFRARYGGFEATEDLEAIVETKEGLSKISVERIWSEMSRIFTHPKGRAQLDMMHDLGVSDVIGLYSDHFRHELAASVVTAGGTPATVLGILADTPEAAEEISRRWKVSSEELKDAITAADVLCDPASDPQHWLCRATDGLLVNRAIPVLQATDRAEAALALRGPIPQFPIGGRHLLDFCERGPRLGELLQDLRDEWKASNFSLTQEDLIDLGASKVASVRRF